MPLVKSPFLGSAYVSRSRVLNAQRCINLYPELVETRDGKSVGAFYGTPGTVLMATVGDGPIRGMRVVNGTLYVVSGRNFYRVTSAWVITLIDNLTTATGPVQMVNNPTQILLVDGFNAYGYDTTNGRFDTIVLPFTGQHPVACAYQDGFCVVNEAGTEQWWQSDLNDVFNWNALNFSSADGQPDPIVTMIDNHREVWLFGAQTSEVWINGGNPGFTFQRLQGVFIEYGCAAANSAARCGTSILWLGQTAEGNGVVYMSRGYQVDKVSTHAIDREIQSYAVINDAIAWYYQQEGHGFYVLTFPSADATWVYDLNTGLWHERAWWDEEESIYHRHRGNAYAFLRDTPLVGDFEDGRIYALDLNVYTDDGHTKRWLRSWHGLPTGQTALNRIKVNQLQIYMQPGVGNEVPPGYNPQVMLRTSWSGGLSFGNEHQMSIGRIGEVNWRAVQRRLGNGRDPVFELASTDPVKPALLECLLDMEPGTS